ncbi:UDP-N-acetylglucosamine 1-carboxyvinyltransferase [Phocicoccus pinnipedialis]|uniref:UDP-N-acetylglucosamine 1-carboxyvinyltransferase n=1 Tax=Phocicoccus pinnipedialis TaxID=110845 RepID=A0A6V7R4Y0_9BACL|nr:UDP-N-acetylglucosamine 1-carboxyvinyltransferase [Jeotgalicoccus pinnipedialis]MBP1939929.1 UDP-N-acetylglucosamine 1-carboxyvinyltransferase [Jeotgalicoccus pinnipedialis]CAD2072123.1 UDP-N-acetylglucosamine 1-carboxyvinyltransferase 1 [Jeotgalicoccus pinnipedialis]
MERIIVKGGRKLSGSVKIEGAKNAVLPILAASLLASEGKSVISNVPELSDVSTLADLLSILKADVEVDKNKVKIDASNELSTNAPYELVSKMRASMLVMGPLLGRYGKCEVAMPGGCAIGSRPIEQHLKGFEKMGATFNTTDGFIEGRVDGQRLKGAKILLDFPSVGATQNLMMGAALADGVTVIENAAMEPEIVDLANYINRMGGKISGAGTGRMRVVGVEKLVGTKHNVIPDRIEAGTFMIASAITRSEIEIQNVVIEHLSAVVSKLEEMGVKFVEDGENVRVIPNETLKETDIKTLPHPGFPTDMQSQMMALLLSIDGTSIVTETIFENRFMHVTEFNSMNADISLQDNHAVIRGGRELHGARVKATDLRSAAALILAGLIAEGFTIVTELKHLDRGYVDFHGKLERLGANIERVSDETEIEY